MQKIIDMTGQKYGRLTVIRRGENTNGGKVRWLCKCECGNYVTTTRRRLIQGVTKSCGCFRREFASFQHKTHGMSTSSNSKNRLYRIWSGIKDRCHNPKSKYWERYGGRNITVCNEWKNDYMAFHEWAMTHGYSDNLTLDRIDNNKGYCPDNCRWATYMTQENNRTNNVLYEIDGEQITLAMLARRENTTRAIAARNHKEERINDK